MRTWAPWWVYKCTMHNIVPRDPYSLIAPQSMNFNQSAAVNRLFYSKQQQEEHTTTTAAWADFEHKILLYTTSEFWSLFCCCW